MVQLAENNVRFTWFFRLATFVLIVAVLRLAQDALQPMAFAVLLAFLLSPLVVRLTRWGLPRTLAIAITVTVAFAIIGGIGWIVTTQAIGLARELPNYEENLHQKISALKHPEAPPAVSRMSGMVENLRRDLESRGQGTAATAPTDPTAVKPVPVEVRPAEPTRWELARDVITPILRPLGIAGIVVVFVVAILFQREDLRDRFVKLVSAGKLNVATQALDDAAVRVSRYLGMQLVVNAIYGIPIGIGLYFIGIPNALLWGLLATLLRFIPYVGSWIAAVFPVVLSIAIDPGWSKLLATIGLFIIMEIISSNIVEVLIYGASTGISSVALLVAAVFWTWLWGPAGLVLSTPLTVCVLVLGNHVPGLNFLSMLLGNDPVLEPPVQLYQRMLSMESEEMFDLAAKHIGEHSLEEFYEEVFVPALRLAEEDRHSGALADVRQRFIFQSSRELIEELERQDDTPRSGSTDAVPIPSSFTPAVLGIPARDEADDLVARMACHLLRRRQIPAAVSALPPPIDEDLPVADGATLKAVFVSALPPSAVAAARQMYRRAHLRFHDVPIFIGLWSPTISTVELRERLRHTPPDLISTGVVELVVRIEALFHRVPGEVEPPAAIAAIPE